MRPAAAAILAICLGFHPAEAAGPGRAGLAGPADGTLVELMVEFSLDGQKVEGTPLAWDRSVVHLLGRDGRLWEFDPEKALDFRKTADRFRSYSVSDLRGMLLRELGSGYEVSGTGHYLVAHPRRQGDKWPRRFEELYRSFVHYFSVRGFKPVKLPFPLLAVVCKDRGDFLRYLAQWGSPGSAGAVGYYLPELNRIILYDMGVKQDSKDWQVNASVIIHEATHQAAFNTGVHSRYTPPPVWVAEGLATMFEARGVYNSRQYP